MQQVLISGVSTRGVAGARRLGSYSMPFSYADEAWIWAMGALASRRDGERAFGRSGVVRPCEPDDVIKCLDMVYKTGRVTLAHARVLAKWGERRLPPSARHLSEAEDARLWDEALVHLGFALRMKGIVA